MPDDVKTAVDAMTAAFEEFKKTNDARLAEIEKKGAADPVTTEKLAAIEKTLGQFEGVNQKLTLAEAAQKKADADAKALKDQMDRVELKVGRPRPAGGDRIELKSKVNLWARAVIGAHTVGVPNLTAEQQKALADVAAEYKAMSIGDDTTGGYLAPAEYVHEIIKAVTELSPVRSLVRIRPTSSKSIMVPKRTGRIAARRTAEQGTRTETTGLTYGLVELTAPEMYALIDISQQNLEDSAFDLEAEISGEATEQFAVKEGQEFISGTGVGEMEGILVNTEIGTTVSGAATTVTGDGLISLKHAIKTDYTKAATFLLNRTTLGSVRKLKDLQGQYLWMPGLAAGKPNTIDGDPYVEVPDMPNEGAGAKPVAYGDWQRAYNMVDRVAMQMLRDPYTQATSGLIRFLFRRRVGGMVVLAEAARTLTCST